MIAREESWRAIDQHAATCPLQRDKISERLRTLEISYGRLLGFLLGSGALGGVTGAVVSKLMP